MPDGSRPSSVSSGRWIPTDPDTERPSSFDYCTLLSCAFNFMMNLCDILMQVIRIVTRLQGLKKSSPLLAAPKAPNGNTSNNQQHRPSESIQPAELVTSAALTPSTPTPLTTKSVFNTMISEALASTSLFPATPSASNPAVKPSSAAKRPSFTNPNTSTNNITVFTSIPIPTNPAHFPSISSSGNLAGQVFNNDRQGSAASHGHEPSPVGLDLLGPPEDEDYYPLGGPTLMRQVSKPLVRLPQRHSTTELFPPEVLDAVNREYDPEVVLGPFLIDGSPNIYYSNSNSNDTSPSHMVNGRSERDDENLAVSLRRPISAASGRMTNSASSTRLQAAGTPPRNSSCSALSQILSSGPSSPTIAPSGSALDLNLSASPTTPKMRPSIQRSFSADGRNNENAFGISTFSNSPSLTTPVASNGSHSVSYVPTPVNVPLSIAVDALSPPNAAGIMDPAHAPISMSSSPAECSSPLYSYATAVSHNNGNHDYGQVLTSTDNLSSLRKHSFEGSRGSTVVMDVDAEVTPHSHDTSSHSGIASDMSNASQQLAQYLSNMIAATEGATPTPRNSFFLSQEVMDIDSSSAASAATAASTRPPIKPTRPPQAPMNSVSAGGLQVHRTHRPSKDLPGSGASNTEDSLDESGNSSSNSNTNANRAAEPVSTSCRTRNVTSSDVITGPSLSLTINTISSDNPNCDTSNGSGGPGSPSLVASSSVTSVRNRPMSIAARVKSISPRIHFSSSNR